MLHGKEGDSIHEGSLMTWDPMIFLHEEVNKKNSNGQQRRKCSFSLNCFHMFSRVFHFPLDSSTIDSEVRGSESVSHKSGVVESSLGSNNLQ